MSTAEAKPFAAAVQRVMRDHPEVEFGGLLWWHMATSVALRQEQHLRHFPRVSATFALPSAKHRRLLKTFAYVHVDRAARILTARVCAGKSLRVSVLGEPCPAVESAVARALAVGALDTGDYFVHYVLPPAAESTTPLLFGTTHILPRCEPRFKPHAPAENVGVEGVAWESAPTDSAEMLDWVRPRDDERTFVVLEHRLTRHEYMWTLGEMTEGGVTRAVWDALHQT